MLTVALLGPVEVRRDDEPVPVPSGRTTEVLVRLALEAGRSVRAEQILDELWAGSEGRNTLQSKVSQLRRALGGPAPVSFGHGGYRLDVDDVDLLAVERLAGQVTEARRAGDLELVRDRAAAALAHFRGDVLQGAGDGAWLEPHRRRWEEVRLGLVEDHLAARVALGAGGDVVGELEELTERHPLREGLWSSLVTALYRAGRQADALAAYARVRRRLLEDLGVDPGPGLRRLEEEILAQSASLAGLGPAPDRRPGNLPPVAPGLVGRATESAALHALLTEHRVVTVVGPAGVGKSRTALAVAHGRDEPGGAWLVRLDGVSDPSSVPRAVAEALHVPAGELAARFAGPASVLLLDNAEHLRDAVADLVELLLVGAPRLRILVTSQVPLALDAEAAFTLAPLAPDDASALFAARAARLPRPVTLTDETADAVDQLCRRLDGLPLALELAAARLASLSVPELTRRLDDRFALLHDPTRRGPARRRGLQAAIGWSHDLLEPDDRRGLWALAVFAEGAPLSAAEHVIGALGIPAPAALDVVGRLVDRSLVTVDVSGHGAVRYRLLDSIRAFARDRLAEAGLADVAGAAHAAWFAEVADHHALTVRGPEQVACLETVRVDRANIDAALAWCAVHDPPQGLRTAVGFGWTWVVLGDGEAGAARVRRALMATPEADTSTSATALLLAGWLEASAGDLELAAGDLDRAEVLVDDDRLRPDLHRHRAFLRIQQGRPTDVVAEAEAAVAAYRDQGRAWETAAALLLASYGAVMLGDTRTAGRSAADAVALLEPLGDPWGLVHARGMLGAIAQAEGRFDAAATELAGAAAESERLGFRGQAALHLSRLGRVEQQRGDRAAAVATLDRALAAARRSGDPRIAATIRTTLARVLRTSGDDVVALALIEQNDRWYRDAGGGDGALLTRCLLAALAAAEDPETSWWLLGGLRTEAREAGDDEAELAAVDALALLTAQRGEAERAADLLADADALAARVHAVIDADRVDAQRARRLIGERPAHPAAEPRIPG
ncbi:BTAD domain-containing putative transcriptional regulator [Actinomycetospora chibensis]|uniref:BTAD domain-containing putative transcriptional regulator n=1 Tax=Actinomycetospora chibensis TaxID=663606 RepID=A0ABV9RQN7_9PSEU|nr:BTAD domain-containing putative transcriptional regulator [Actinomycetospora chibensis]MDD7924951.1 BTAD domain-containing putative transcriptional regulator [Actinomycetospora chibensis]